MSKKKYKIDEFMYKLTEYIDPEEEFTMAQIANIIGKAMVSFFEDSETPY
jgi:hypothetical protein